jgi:peptidoglycan/LPS O-acetylase OafA/YrhL
VTGYELRYSSLDHWRGLAALAVTLFHGFGVVRGAGLEVHSGLRWLKSVADFGWFGVHLFFVISGYCIAANVYRLATTGRGPWEFVRDRVLRIYPPYWAACALSIAVGLLALPFNHGSLANSLPQGLDAAVANVLLIEPYVNADPLLLVSWSLVFETGFYFLVALGFTLRAWGVNLWILIAIAILLACAGLSGMNAGPFHVLRYWPEFVCGASVFLALWSRPRSRLPAAFISFPVMLVVFAVAVPGDSQTTWQLAGAALFALVLWVLHPFDEAISRWSGIRWMAAVGIISYSLYLVHVPVGGRVVNLLGRFVSASSVSFLWVQVAAWCASLAAGWLFFKYCERPLERLRHRYTRGAPMPAGAPTVPSRRP